MNVDSLSLTNISNKKVNSVNLSLLNSFISSYSYPIDKSYKGNSEDKTMSHKITFIKGLGQDSVVLTGQAGAKITVPTVSNVTYNGVTYRFVGWYMDKDLTLEYNLATFDNDNHKIYAKYEEI